MSAFLLAHSAPPSFSAWIPSPPFSTSIDHKYINILHQAPLHSLDQSPFIQPSPAHCLLRASEMQQVGGHQQKQQQLPFNRAASPLKMQTLGKRRSSVWKGNHTSFHKVRVAHTGLQGTGRGFLRVLFPPPHRARTQFDISEAGLEGC